MTCGQFIAQYIRLVNPVTKRVENMRLYPLQRTFIEQVFDTFDPVTGLRRYRQAVFSTPKKFGKTTLTVVQGLYGLLFDPFEPHDREVYSLAGDIDQASYALQLAKRIVRNDPFLTRNVKIYQHELVVEDDGGVHRWRARSTDAPTEHGVNPSLVLVDEGWQFADHDLLAAMALGPQRACPLQLWSTYAGLQSDMVDGRPLFDLYKRGKAGTDPTLFFIWRSGEDAYHELPRGFIRDGYLDEQRRILPANEFQRLHLNEWGQATVGFLSSGEIATAIRRGVRQPDRSERPHILAVDYGRTSDHTAFTAVRRGEFAGHVEVTLSKALQGTKDAPVPLDLVEDTIADLYVRLNVQRILVDPWQMHGSMERLSRRLKLPIFDAAKADSSPHQRAIISRPIGGEYQNRLARALLALFRTNAIAIPEDCEDLLQQLGSVVAKATWYGTRIDSGVGRGVRAHDDLVVALGMACLELGLRGSGVELPAFRCLAGASYERTCFLTDAEGGHAWPTRPDMRRICRHCLGWQAVDAAHQRAQIASGSQIDVHEFNRTQIKRLPMYASVATIPDLF